MLSVVFFLAMERKKEEEVFGGKQGSTRKGAKKEKKFPRQDNVTFWLGHSDSWRRRRWGNGGRQRRRRRRAGCEETMRTVERGSVLSLVIYSCGGWKRTG